jgi:hypothetical protein
LTQVVLAFLALVLPELNELDGLDVEQVASTGECFDGSVVEVLQRDGSSSKYHQNPPLGFFSCFSP